MRLRALSPILGCLISWGLVSTTSADDGALKSVGHAVGQVSVGQVFGRQVVGGQVFGRQVVGHVSTFDGITWSPDPRKNIGPGVWRHEIHRPGAAFLKARLSEADLRRGDVLSILDGSGRVVERLRGDDRPSGPRWAAAVPGERLVLELTYARPYEAAPFKIDRLAMGDPGAWEAARPPGPRTKSVCEPAEFSDAVCHQADAGRWAAIRATAGVLQVAGDELIYCSGVNVSPRNQILTTRSCIPDDDACADAEFIFGHYRSGCGTGDVVDTWRGYRCLGTVASSPFDNLCDPDASHLDFALLQLDGDVTTDWGYVDPDPTPLVSGEALYISQHAGGRPLELSEGSGADVVVDGLTLRYYGSLDTESSSVGAPIFRDSDDRLVGLHHCGGCATPGVGNRGVRMQDIEPLIATHLCSDTATLEGAPIAEIAQEPGLGNNDSVLDPGETWYAVPRARNVACALDAVAVVASFAVAGSSIAVDLLDTTSSFGSVPAGATALGTPIRFHVAAGTACAGEVRLDLVSIADAAGSHAGTTDYLVQDLGEVPTTTVLKETFDGGIPGTWTVEHLGTGSGEASTWTADDPGMRALFATPFAIVDSELLGPGSTMDERLVSPAVDASGFANWTLRLRHDFRYFDGEMAEKAVVDVRSTATAGAWTEVLRFQGADASGTSEVDVTAQAASDFEIRLRYFDAEWEWWWAVDEVALAGDDGRRCFTGLFIDGFESGDTTAWSATVP